MQKAFGRRYFSDLNGLLAGTANAQIPMEVYQNPQNLRVLSQDISPEELRATMFSIGQQVGLRCSKCHDFEPDAAFAERDYASDQNELKRVAREMMLMLQSINETVSTIDRGSGHTSNDKWGRTVIRIDLSVRPLF